MSIDLRLSPAVRLNADLSVAVAESIAAEIIHEAAHGAEWIKVGTVEEDGAFIYVESSRAWLGEDSPMQPTRIEAFVAEGA